MQTGTMSGQTEYALLYGGLWLPPRHLRKQYAPVGKKDRGNRCVPTPARGKNFPAATVGVPVSAIWGGTMFPPLSLCSLRRSRAGSFLIFIFKFSLGHAFRGLDLAREWSDLVGLKENREVGGNGGRGFPNFAGSL